MSTKKSVVLSLPAAIAAIHEGTLQEPDFTGANVLYWVSNRSYFGVINWAEGPEDQDEAHFSPSRIHLRNAVRALIPGISDEQIRAVAKRLWSAMCDPEEPKRCFGWLSENVGILEARRGHEAAFNDFLEALGLDRLTPETTIFSNRFPPNATLWTPPTPIADTDSVRPFLEQRGVRIIC